MDDALLVANLVYIGTLAIGGVLFIFFSIAFVITLLLAGTGQGIASLVGLMLRPFQGLARRGQERTTATPAQADHVRAAVVAKAEAILAAQKAAAQAAQARETGTPKEERKPEPEDVPAPAALPAPAQRLALTGKSTVAVVRAHTGTQPILTVKAS